MDISIFIYISSSPTTCSYSIVAPLRTLGNACTMSLVRRWPERLSSRSFAGHVATGIHPIRPWETKERRKVECALDAGRWCWDSVRMVNHHVSSCIIRLFTCFVMKWPNKVPFSTIMVPSGTVMRWTPSPPPPSIYFAPGNHVVKPSPLYYVLKPSLAGRQSLRCAIVEFCSASCMWVTQRHVTWKKERKTREPCI